MGYSVNYHKEVSYEQNLLNGKFLLFTYQRLNIIICECRGPLVFDNLLQKVYVKSTQIENFISSILSIIRNVLCKKLLVMCLL